MPGRFFLDAPITEVANWLGADIGACADEPVRCNIAPGQNIVVCVNGALTRMRWGMIPVGRVNARGRPIMETVINARSETVFDKSAFDGVRRCVVPMSGWYEWTGEKRKKTAWRICARQASLMAFAAVYDVWTAPGGQAVPQVATLTCEPNADVRAIHHRMGVILTPDTVSTWLTGSETQAAAVLKPLPDGRLDVTPALNVDWSAP